MTDAPPFDPLSELVRRYGPDPSAFEREWTVPVLLRRRDMTPQAILQPDGFHTQAQDSSVLDVALRGPRRLGMTGEHARLIGANRLPMPDDVIRLEKRDGGAFATRIGIGRAPNVDVQILLSKISKYHAYVTIDDDGVVHLADARSSFGTFVEQEQLEPMTPIALGDGVAVRLASYEFRFHTAKGLGELIALQHRLASR